MSHLFGSSRVIGAAPEWIEAHRRQTVAIASALALLIAIVDWRVTPNVSLGLLYAIPLFLASLVISRAQIFTSLPFTESIRSRSGGGVARSARDRDGGNEAFRRSVLRARVAYLASNGGAVASGNRQCSTRRVLWDASDDVRQRNLASTESLRMTTGVALAAFSHEVKNISAAAAMLAGRLAARPELRDDPDIRALTAIIHSCSRLAGSGLVLGAAMNETRLASQSLAEESGVHISWQLPERLPVVRCDDAALIEVFLNLFAIASMRCDVRASRIGDPPIDPPGCVGAGLGSDPVP
jgi:signal transduction histidine kinase